MHVKIRSIGDESELFFATINELSSLVQVRKGKTKFNAVSFFGNSVLNKMGAGTGGDYWDYEVNNYLGLAAATAKLLEGNVKQARVGLTNHVYFSVTKEDNRVSIMPTNMKDYASLSKAEKLIEDTTGEAHWKDEVSQKVFFNDDDFRSQVYAPLPELATMLNFLLVGKVMNFEYSEKLIGETSLLFAQVRDKFLD